MIKMISRSILGFVPVFWIIITLSFIVIRAAPGSPFSQEQRLPEVVKLNLEKKYGLDKPIFIQYINYLKGIIKGDLGESTAYPDYSVSTYLWRGFKVSLTLGVISVVLGYLLGFIIGILAALNHGRWGDYLLMFFALLSISLPVFIRGPLFIKLFAEELKWLPTSGWINEGAIRIILPLLAIVPTQAAVLSRFVRTSTLRVLNNDYVRTARAKGLSATRVVLVHMFPGIFTPVISFLGPAFASAVTGSFIVEQIFRIPGMGTYFVQSSLNRDYFLLLGGIVFYSILLLIANAIADLLYRAVDPRVTYETRK